MKAYKRATRAFSPALKFLALPAFAAIVVLSGCNGAADGGILNSGSTSTSTPTATPTPTPTPGASKISLLLSNTNVSATSAVTVTVRVLDSSNILVSGKAVSLQASSGTISNISNGSVTDSNGTLTFNIAAPAGVSSGTITVTATVDSVQQTASINIIGNTAASIKLGTSNQMSALDTTRYEVPYNALVTDATGNPVSNATVTLTITPINWFQGYWLKGANGWSQTVAGAVICTTGGNCNPATISPATTLLTDPNGYVTFNVLYAKNFAFWADVNITATATLAGGPTTDSTQFVLPGMATDFGATTTAVPGLCSPFNSSANQFGTVTINGNPVATGC